MNETHQLTRRNMLRRTAAGLAGLASAQVFTQSARAATEAGFRIGIYTRPWDQFEYRVALDAIAEAGYKHAGLMTAKSKTRLVVSGQDTIEYAHQVGEEVKKRGLQVPSVYAGGIPVQESLEAGIAGMKKIVDNCAAVGTRSILMGGMARENLYKLYYKAIAECCDYAAEKGMRITIKTHGGLNATGPQCRKAVELVGHKNFGVWYDPGNVMYYAGGEVDLAKDVAAVDGHVMGACIKDFKLPKDVWLTPGTGLVDFPGVFNRLKKGGFTKGDVVVETFARGKPATLPALLAEAKKARKFTEDLLA